MSALQGSVRHRVQQNGSRAAHRVCTRVTNALLALTRFGWTQRLLAPNTPQARYYAARTTSAAPIASNGAAEEPEPAHAVSSSASSSSTPHSSCAADASRRVRHVLITVHGYLGLPRPFFLFRAPAVNAGYHVVDYSYASGGDMDSIADGLIDVVRRTADELSERSHAAAVATQSSASASVSSSAGPSSRSKVYDELCFSFVCHSMGGLVLRAAVSSGRFPVPIPPVEAASGESARSAAAPAAAPAVPGQLPLSFGRIVMIATPNRGSQYARMLAQYPLIKSTVLGFAKMTVPGAADINEWVRGVRNNVAARSRGSSAGGGADSGAGSVSGGSRQVAPAPLADVLACGDLLMSHPPEWFHTHLPLPRSLYPRTLVIAGTLALLPMLPAPSDGTITFEETLLPAPVDATAEERAQDASYAAAAAAAATSRRRTVVPGPLGSSHMSFHAQHSALVAHPGVIKATLQHLRTGNAEPEAIKTAWD